MWIIFSSESLMSLSERLAGPFNVEMTIEPISIKISDAIMNFQESGFQVNIINFFHVSRETFWVQLTTMIPTTKLEIFNQLQNLFLLHFFFWIWAIKSIEKFLKHFQIPIVPVTFLPLLLIYVLPALFSKCKEGILMKSSSNIPIVLRVVCFVLITLITL